MFGGSKVTIYLYEQNLLPRSDAYLATSAERYRIRVVTRPIDRLLMPRPYRSPI